MFISQIAQAMARVRLAKEVQASELKAETESLRNSLLSAISHDFRSPLASIVGASSGLLEGGAYLSEEEKLELTRTVNEEARRMSGLANNILNIARLEAGAVTLNRDWYPIDEVVGGVLTRLHHRLENYPVATSVAPGLPMIKIDAVMIGQILENLLENAFKYTPAGTPIEIGASGRAGEVTLWVADRGPGLPAGEEEKLFEKFYRGTMEAAQSGAGLGLTICRAIAKAHGGDMRGENRSGGGAIFSFSMPLKEQPPRLVPEEEQSAEMQS
jgi:two-component system sensor histidine kinase KdpD